MKKQVLLIVFMVFLMVMNGVLLFLVTRNTGRKPRPPKEFIADRLDFNQEQLARFMELEEEHHRKMRTIDERFLGLKETLFAHMGEVNFQKKNLDSIAGLIGTLAQEREMEVFNHFNEIEKICHGNQKQRLKRIVATALRRGPAGAGPPPHRPPPPHK
ncbi:MAG: hypothetical protein AAGB24_11015 [Bacteroidota bacterium]